MNFKSLIAAAAFFATSSAALADGTCLIEKADHTKATVSYSGALTTSALKAANAHYKSCVSCKKTTGRNSAPVPCPDGKMAK